MSGKKQDPAALQRDARKIERDMARAVGRVLTAEQIETLHRCMDPDQEPANSRIGKPNPWPIVQALALVAFVLVAIGGALLYIGVHGGDDGDGSGRSGAAASAGR